MIQSRWPIVVPRSVVGQHHWFRWNHGGMANDWFAENEKQIGLTHRDGSGQPDTFIYCGCTGEV